MDNRKSPAGIGGFLNSCRISYATSNFMKAKATVSNRKNQRVCEAFMWCETSGYGFLSSNPMNIYNTLPQSSVGTSDKICGGKKNYRKKVLSPNGDLGTSKRKTALFLQLLSPSPSVSFQHFTDPSVELPASDIKGQCTYSLYPTHILPMYATSNKNPSYQKIGEEFSLFSLLF